MASSESCGCSAVPYRHLTDARELGMDSRFAEASVLVCRECGRHWLRYFYEVEAFTGSGRWYLGAIPPEQASRLGPEEAKATLEGLSWYYYGGSYFEGRSGKTSGTIPLGSVPPDLEKLISVFEEARRLLALPGNDFAWSSWEDSRDALEEIDRILSALRSGIRPRDGTLEILFAPTGPLQEVGLSSGWGDDFIALARRFDDAIADETG